MSIVEFYDTSGSAHSDLNGGGPRLGANDGPIYTSADVSSDGISGSSLTDNSGNDWGIVGGGTPVAVGDYLMFDTAVQKIVVEVTAVSYVGDDDTILISPSVGASKLNKNVNVGGAWEHPDVAVALVEDLSSYFDDGSPPRINVRGNVTASGTCTLVVGWTQLVPLIVQGCEATPGDVPTTRPTWTHTNTVVDLDDFDDSIWADLHFRKTAGGNTLFDTGGADTVLMRCTLEATTGDGALLLSLALGSKVLACTLTNTGDATGRLANAMYGLGDGCIFDNGEIYYHRGPLNHCRFTDVWFTSYLGTYGGINDCTIHVAAGHDGISVDSAAIFPVIRNTIIAGVASGYAAVVSETAKFAALIGDHNFWDEANADDIQAATISLYFDGNGDVTDDPDLDANDIPKHSSPVIGAGDPLYLDIGAIQRQVGGLLAHAGMTGGING